jgi:hypothetical protein
MGFSRHDGFASFYSWLAEMQRSGQRLAPIDVAHRFNMVTCEFDFHPNEMEIDGDLTVLGLTKLNPDYDGEDGCEAELLYKNGASPSWGWV